MRSSLRTSLVVGAILWTIGTVIAVHFLSLGVILHITRRPATVHWVLISFTAAALLVFGLSQVQRSLSPLLRLRARLQAMREGRERRIEGDYPAEVQPLVDDLNALLEDRERRVARARAMAGDLAHGLKTPLAVLSQEAERLSGAGDPELARSLAQQIERMRRQVESHLARARAAASRATPEARCRVQDSTDGLARTMLRLYADRGLSLRVLVSPEHEVLVDRADLDEMLGNLLDNACKWARSRVALESAERDGTVVVTVDDDGGGLDPALRDKVLERGVRADQAAPGSGFGLAIVRDLAELYGGSIALEGSPAGGLRARLSLPARPRGGEPPARA